MLKIPERIHVEVVGEDGRPLRIENILIAMNTFVDGNYYYGDIVGLTDSNGQASVTRAELNMRFMANRELFPMDYRVALEDSDSVVEFCILGEDEIRRRRDSSARSSMTGQWARDLYERADNRTVAPSTTRVDLSQISDARTSIEINTQRAEQDG